MHTNHLKPNDCSHFSYNPGYSWISLNHHPKRQADFSINWTFQSLFSTSTNKPCLWNIFLLNVLFYQLQSHSIHGKTVNPCPKAGLLGILSAATLIARPSFSLTSFVNAAPPFLSASPPRWCSEAWYENLCSSQNQWSLYCTLILASRLKETFPKEAYKAQPNPMKRTLWVQCPLYASRPSLTVTGQERCQSSVQSGSSFIFHF